MCAKFLSSIVHEYLYMAKRKKKKEKKTFLDKKDLQRKKVKGGISDSF